MAGVNVYIYERDKLMRQVETDASGRYAGGNLDAGQLIIRATPVPGGASVEKTVVIAAGQNLTIDVAAPAPGQISGRITDADKKPLLGMLVVTFGAEYSYGALRYNLAGYATTDLAGEYLIRRLEPGRTYIVMAGKGVSYSAPISNAPTDPEKRTPVPMPAYYPGGETAASATPVILAPGERRELIDIQLRNTPSRCIEGKAQSWDGGAVRFVIGENEPLLRNHAARAGVGLRTATADGGKFRICDLHAGEYWLDTFGATDMLRNHATQYISVGDKDISNIVANITPQFAVEGDIVWDGKPPDDPAASQPAPGISLFLFNFGGPSITPGGPLPRHFALPVGSDAYELSVRPIPAGAYVKDITYRGHSILNQLFEPGSAAAADGLRIVLARDGGRISVKAADKDGNAITDANIVVMPANATSEATMASAMITAQTDAFGTWTSGPIAPGKYYIIVTTTPASHSIETIAKLWRARSASEVVEVAPNGSAQLTRIPAPID
jgi:hypothetical protein